MDDLKELKMRIMSLEQQQRRDERIIKAFCTHFMEQSNKGFVDPTWKLENAIKKYLNIFEK